MRRQKIRARIPLLVSSLMLFSACAGSKKAKNVSSATVAKSTAKDEGKGSEESHSGSDVSKSKRTLTFSRSSNALTSHRLKKSTAREFAQDLKSVKASANNILQLEAAVTAHSLGGGSFNNVFAASRKLMAAQLARNVNSELPDMAKLQLAIAAVNEKRYPMAEHFMADIQDSKNPRIRAAALNLQGLLALEEKRLPEAIVFWRQALKAVGNYKPALLNIGFVSLRYGDFRTAKKMLSPFQNDWFALYGLLVAERLAGNVGRVESLCSRVLSQKSDYKPAMLSCALNKYQGKGQFAEAKEMLNDLVKTKSGPSFIDEIAYKVIAQIGKAEAEAKSKSKSNTKSKAPVASKGGKAPKAQKTKASKN